MADEWKEYVNNARTVCKYGAKCYQKNPEHHQKFKHPPQTIRKDVHRNKRRFSPYTKDSPRHSPKPRGKDEAPSGNSEDTAANDDNDIEKPANDDNNDSKEKTVNNDSDDKSEQHEVPKLECEKVQAVALPDNITFYDKCSDNSLLKELFLVEMPTDFFKFFECIRDCGKSVEDTLASVNLMPIGPYELLLGKLPQLDNKELYLIHWRFFYDPPEFQVPYKQFNVCNDIKTFAIRLDLVSH